MIIDLVEPLQATYFCTEIRQARHALGWQQRKTTHYEQFFLIRISFKTSNMFLKLLPVLL